jgi:3D (Asp-Asp-Asp) domain-containing protein
MYRSLVKRTTLGGVRRLQVVVVVPLVALAGCGAGATTAANPSPAPAAKRAAPAPAAKRAAPTPAGRQRAARDYVLGSPGPMPRCARAEVRRTRPIRRPTVLRNVAVTEYFSVPERWFSGRFVHAPGLRGRFRVDWLYSARGLALEGEGVARNGHYYGVGDVSRAGWVNRRGRATAPGRCAGRWSHDWPVWADGGWRNRAGQVTWPLSGGGWANGPGRRAGRVPMTFASRSRPQQRPYRSVAVDPSVIPLGSRVYIPAYRAINGGWFTADDVGGAIQGRHVDVYRTAPRRPGDRGRVLRHQTIQVVPPRIP